MSIQIFVKNGLNGKTNIYDIDEKEYVLNLKQQIYKQEYIMPENQRLIYAGKQLLNDKKICDYYMQKGSCIHLINRLNGG